MNKSEVKAKRREILLEMDALNRREAAGEDVSVKLKECGQRLSRLSGKPQASLKKKKITREVKHLAASRGLSFHTLEYRVYTLGWDIERAASVPPQRKSNPYEVGLTVDNYQQLKDKGMLDSEIRETYHISQHMLHKFKNENGLLVRTWKRKKVAE